jgi:polysaccharide deacetylase family protein (PEP-CTERM system associated)
MTCDVEDYFQVSAFEHMIAKDDWRTFECRIPANIDRILQLFADAGVKGTFFTLGWVARHYPEVVKRIADEGHEIASHGMQHVRVWTQQRDEFLNDILTTKGLLEDAGGTSVKGFRAASWSLDERTPWAYNALLEAGYDYSSSIYPISHDHYGMPSAPAAPFYIGSTDLLEIPASTTRFAGRNLPAAGGGYFRLMPFSLSLWLLRRVTREQGIPAVFYFHPWELDPGQPRIAGVTVRTRFRHYLNLDKFEGRLQNLLKSLPWDRMDKAFSIGRDLAT